MGIEENKIMVNVGIPFSMLQWIDANRKVSRSIYLGEIVIPEIERRMKDEKNQEISIQNKAV